MNQHTFLRRRHCGGCRKSDNLVYRQFIDILEAAVCLSHDPLKPGIVRAVNSPQHLVQIFPVSYDNPAKHGGRAFG